MATMYSFTRDPTLLRGGEHGGALDIYEWLISTDLLNPETGYQRDTLDTADGQCQLSGGVCIFISSDDVPSLSTTC